MHEIERCQIILQQEKWKPQLVVKSLSLFHYKNWNNFNTWNNNTYKYNTQLSSFECIVKDVIKEITALEQPEIDLG